MGRFHTTLISDKLVATVNFYEDFFGFVAVIEKDGYVLLQKQDDPDLCISVFETTHKCVKDVPPVKGLILNMYNTDVKETYDHLYMEGLEFFKALGTDIHGNNHFVVIDPNGVLINVCEPIEALQMVAA